MKKYPILTSGEKLVTEDANAAFLAAGTADDAVHASMLKIPVQGTVRQGWVRPWRDGSLVVPSGSDGKVKVRPFTMFMSPKGATTEAGTEDASGGSETTADLKSGRYEGGLVSVATPLPSAGNMRWDLLYATISEADSDAASRLVASVSGGTKVVAVSTINTRHGSSVALAWVQGGDVATGGSYTTSDLPTLPVASAGTANVPLAYVQVQNSATPATVAYSIDRIYNAPWLARTNPQTGAPVSAAGIAAGKVSLAGAFDSAATSILTTAAAQGGWALSGTNIRPVRAIEPLTGGVDLWIPIGPFSTTGGNKTFGATFAASPYIKIATALATGAADGFDIPWDWRGRFFHGTLVWGTVAMKFAWDLSGTTTALMPSSMQSTGFARTVEGWGNSINGNDTFNTAAATTDFYLAAFFHDVNSGGGSNDDLAVIVDKSTGDLYLTGREANTNALNGAIGMLHLRASGQTLFSR